MGMFDVYACTSCSHTIRLGGPIEFRKRWFRSVELAHPLGDRETIDGLWLDMWCPQCRDARHVVLTEFARPSSPIAVLNGTAPIRNMTIVGDDAIVVCPVCGEEVDKRLPPHCSCPKCETGTLVFTQRVHT